MLHMSYYKSSNIIIILLYHFLYKEHYGFSKHDLIFYSNFDKVDKISNNR